MYIHTCNIYICMSVCLSVCMSNGEQMHVCMYNGEQMQFPSLLPPSRESPEASIGSPSHSHGSAMLQSLLLTRDKGTTSCNNGAQSCNKPQPNSHASGGVCLCVYVYVGVCVDVCVCGVCVCVYVLYTYRLQR